ncbi:MAG TPA: VWA domain-containing protein [Pyrinomonadaceae bacterium]|jgi:VWFA-related protein
MRNYHRKFFLFIILTITFCSFALSQTPQTTPDEQIKIVTEEVHLNVTAQTSGGRFVPTLTKDDLLIVEEGTPQTIESMKRVPASVLLLLDTGGNFNFAKTINMTRLTAKLLVQNLSSEDSIAVMQAYNKIETVSGWTSARDRIQDDLDKKLFGGNRSQFINAVNGAIEMFKARPLENRHLVFIGDGLDSVASAADRQRALQNLLAANITVHVIAYNKMEASRALGATRPFQIGEERETPRLPDHVLEAIIETMPRGMRDNFRRMVKSERLFVIRLDNKAIKVAKQKREEWIKGEAEFQTLAEDTGGIFQAPEEPETMLLFAHEIAKAIGSQYVVTYVPTKPFANAETAESRKIRVGTHCNGVQIRSRHKVVLNPVNDK